MSSADKLINIIKTISTNAADARQGVAVMFGVVLSTEPLEIKVDQRFILDEDFLVLTSRVLESKINMDHTHKYIDSNDTSSLTKDTESATTLDSEIDIKDITLVHSLKENDKVLLLRVQGGQKYVVLDKVV